MRERRQLNRRPDDIELKALQSNKGSREAVDVVFQAFNRYLGVAVGEHLGYALTGAWTTLAGVALTQTAAAPACIGVLGIVIGPVLALCSFEFLGGREEG